MQYVRGTDDLKALLSQWQDGQDMDNVLDLVNKLHLKSKTYYNYYYCTRLSPLYSYPLLTL